MVIVPHHVVLILSDLVKTLEAEKERAMLKADKAALMDADECAYWAAYSCGLGDALTIVKGTVDSL
jgi:hypothetical protein